MLGTILGVLLIGVINNGLTLHNVEPFWVQFIQGSVIFLAVLFELAQPEASGRINVARPSSFVRVSRVRRNCCRASSCA